MSDLHFNKLTPAQAERLAILSEELGEALQAVGKILRHGYESFDPTVPQTMRTNRSDLEKEIGDIQCAVTMLAENDDIDAFRIRFRANQKAEKIKPYLHHQEKLTKVPADPTIRSCNRHSNCDSAEAEVLARNPGARIALSFHCHDERLRGLLWLLKTIFLFAARP
jgi:NTP pyrophosphatase (non-canonical NTP hydrolase)